MSWATLSKSFIIIFWLSLAQLLITGSSDAVPSAAANSLLVSSHDPCSLIQKPHEISDAALYQYEKQLESCWRFKAAKKPPRYLGAHDHKHGHDHDHKHGHDHDHKHEDGHAQKHDDVAQKHDDVAQKHDDVAQKHDDVQDHQHRHDKPPASAIKLICHKLGAFILMALVGVAGCFLPVCLRGTAFLDRIIAYVNAFACGTFLGLALFHLMPEALHVAHLAKLGFTVGASWHNLVFFVAFLGFVLILFLERVLLAGSDEEVLALGHRSSVHESGIEHLKTAACMDPKHSHHHHVAVVGAACQLQVYEDKDPTGCEDPKRCDSVIELEAPNVAHALSDDVAPVIHFSAVAFFATLSLSVHSVFEGMVLGTFSESASVWIAASSMCGHKWAAGFALALNIGSANMSRTATWIYLSIFIWSSPVGVLIGLGISHTNSMLVAVIDALSLGIILFISCELTFDEFGSSGSFRKEVLKFVIFVSGAMVVFALYLLHIFYSDHGHDEGHSH